MKRRFSSRLFLALGLASLVLTSVLAAIYLGIVPDREHAVRQGRLALSENVAVSAAILLAQGDDRTLHELLEFTRERNPELLSIGVRPTGEPMLMTVGEQHEFTWRPPADGKSSDQFVQVPIVGDAQRPWGTLELRFQPLRSPGLLGWLESPRIQLSVFLFAAGLISFSIYLRRMLRHLDPAKVIPGRVRTALDTLAEGLLIIDRDGMVVLANRSIAASLGKEPDALIGTRADQLGWTGSTGAPLPAEQLPWEPTLREGRSARHGVVHIGNDAGLQVLRVNASPVLGEGKRQQGSLVSFQDITELERKEVALRAAKDEADLANKTKSDFLANMSHEIRTPMNAILGFTELLRRGTRSQAETSRYLETIRSSGTHLLGLINDILDLSKVESGKLEVERIGFACHEVVQQVVRALAVKAAEKSLGLSVEYPTALPRTMLGDPARLRQVLTNLIGNALKFTLQGGVRVRPRLEGSRLYIDVVDSGIGIAPDKLAAVFEPFVQAEASTTRRFGGTGLGLSISRDLARAMGGDITARSEAGGGSVFTVELDPGPLDNVERLTPAELILAESAMAQPEQTQRWQFEPARVLLVDDGRENREFARVVLEDAGLEVSEAANGQIAVDMIGRERFDAVLMDVQMPVMDGYTATRLLRERGVALPILALTANAMKGFENEIDAAGFSAYLTKPIDIPLLMKALSKYLIAREVSGDAQAAATALTRDPGLPQATGEPLVSRLAQHPRLAAVVRSFGQQLPDRLSAMQRALEAADFAELSRLAHWLKGAGGSVGYDGFYDPSVQLEQAAKSQDASGAGRALGALNALAVRMVLPEVGAATMPQVASAAGGKRA